MDIKKCWRVWKNKESNKEEAIELGKDLVEYYESRLQSNYTMMIKIIQKLFYQMIIRAVNQILIQKF